FTIYDECVRIAAVAQVAGEYGEATFTTTLNVYRFDELALHGIKLYLGRLRSFRNVIADDSLLCKRIGNILVKHHYVLVAQRCADVLVAAGTVLRHYQRLQLIDLLLLLFDKILLLLYGFCKNGY